MARIFGEFLLVSVSNETKHENSAKDSGKIRSNIRGANFGTKIRKIRRTFVLQLSDLRKIAVPVVRERKSAQSFLRKVFQIRDIPTQIPGHSGHALPVQNNRRRPLAESFRLGYPESCLGPWCPRKFLPKHFMFRLGNAPARHRALPGPSGPEPQKSPKRVRKGVRKGVPPRGGPRVPKECATESEKSPKRVRSCVFGLFSDSVAHSLGTLGLSGAGHPFGLFWGAGPEGPGRPLCLAGAFPSLGCFSVPHM